MKDGLILKNAVRCKKCNTIIESIHVHDFKTCTCGSVSVDGGKHYLKRSFKNYEDYEDLSKVIDTEKES